MMSDYQYDVFLSHNSKDKPAVKWLAVKLTDEAKLKVFLDVWNLIPGDPWQEDLEEALDLSQTVVIFLGPAGISGWHNEELRNALTKQVSDRDRRVIPVLLPGTTMPEDNDIPSFLTRFTWVDFRNGLDDEESFHRLVSGINGEAPGRYGEHGEYCPPSKPTPRPYKPKIQMRENSVSTGVVNSGRIVGTGKADDTRRNKNVTVGERGIAIGGNVTGSTIVTGDHNVIGSTITLQSEYIQQIFTEIDEHPNLEPLDKEDLKFEVKELQREDTKGQYADETRISRNLRNINRMAPNILHVVLATIENPVAGFGIVVRKVAENMKAESK